MCRLLTTNRWCSHWALLIALLCFWSLLQYFVEGDKKLHHLFGAVIIVIINWMFLTGKHNESMLVLYMHFCNGVGPGSSVFVKTGPEGEGSSFLIVCVCVSKRERESEIRSIYVITPLLQNHVAKHCHCLDSDPLLQCLSRVSSPHNGNAHYLFQTHKKSVHFWNTSKDNSDEMWEISAPSIDSLII